MLGKAIKEARECKNISQKELARDIYLSNKTISAVETGRRDITEDNLKTVCNKLNDPHVYIEAASKVCGDVFGLHWLDGKATDLHRACVKEKTIEELSEAIRAINLTKIYKSPKACNSAEIEDIKASVQETIDVFNASAIYIAIACKEYDLDIKEMFRIQKEKLIRRGYLKKERFTKNPKD